MAVPAQPEQPARAGPLIWLAREGPAIIGQYAAMPVRLSLCRTRSRRRLGHGRDGGPGAAAAGPRRDPVRHLGPERRARRSASASPPSSSRLFKKLRWPEVGAVALPREAADAAGPAAAGVVADRQPRRVGGHRSRSSRWSARAATAARARRRSPADSTTSSRSCGSGWRRSSTSRSAATPPYLQWKLHRRAARALPGRGADARRANRRATRSTATCTRRADA